MRRRIFWAGMGALTIGVGAVFVFWGAWIEVFVNPWMWVVANTALLYTFIVMTAYTVFYFFCFNWRQYEGPRRLMERDAAFLGIILLAFVGVFLNPVNGASWFMYPSDILVWRPLLRAVFYTAAGVAVTRFLWQLIMRYRRGLALQITTEPRRRRGNM